MYRDINTLQANLRRSRSVQDALHNDSALKDFTAILAQEPYLVTINNRTFTPGVGTRWTTFYPTKRADRGQEGRPAVYRSCLWVANGVVASQVAVESPDITAVRIDVAGRKVVLVSVYIPPVSDGQAELLARLQLIEALMDQQKAVDPSYEFIVAGDFNRHDSLWGGDRVAETSRQGEGEPILDSMAHANLQSLLPRGTVTYERDGTAATTIDLSLATTRLADERIRCTLWPEEYGSDHRHIHITYSVRTWEGATEPRLLLKEANWDKIRRELVIRKASRPAPEGLNEMAEWLQEVVNEAVRKHCPLSRPSPYAKRWWSKDLTAMRTEYTSLRNRAKKPQGQGRDNWLVSQEARRSKNALSKAIEAQRKQHWNQFLDEPTNVWKAAKFLHSDGNDRASFAPINGLVVQGETLTNEKDIASGLLQSFFPPTAQPEVTQGQTYSRQLPCHPLQKFEVRAAIWRASMDKAPGPDGFSMRVWREVWPSLGDELVVLMQRSLDKAELPLLWKEATIVPLRKAGKDDYTSAKSYRPISLLQTISKVMESVIAERISYLVETHGLLPTTHFGARKLRSSVDALVHLQERIFRAWRGGKTLSLVSFDVKGAYNNVAKEPELHRLRQRRVPEQLVRWIGSFCTSRKACVMVNGKRSDKVELPHSGLPQGSPLSPILFLFFNAELLEASIPRGSSMAFVNDFTAWVVGKDASENTATIQEHVLPRLKTWEETIGAVFETSKTAFVHFSRTQIGTRWCCNPLTFKGEDIVPTGSVKILGIVMDSALQFRQHLARAAKRGFAAAQAVKRLKNLRPAMARQLVNTVVMPIGDYASAVWSLVRPTRPSPY